MRVARIILAAVSSLCFAEDAVNFSREVLPLLSDKCLSCHGQDPTSRMAGLRLDTREGATEVRKKGAAIVPGKPEESLLFDRITTQSKTRIMPPVFAHKEPLKAEEISVFRRWIEQGAPWGKHWSFEKPVRPTESGIDSLIVKRLKKEGLALATTAPRHTLIRRLSFDLTGLPPRPEEVAAFVNDRSPDALEKLIDRYLDSPHFGERMAMWWLDAARYSDTDGFQADETRTNWPWRDWVVDAFNRNMPFDQFTTEQFAGDLLPNATHEQILATAFHRNHMTNGEGGRDPEESRIDYVLDRANTTGTVFLGLTLGCAQCHSHKFDPISHGDYYSVTAFFNSIDEDGQAGKKAKPYLKHQSSVVSRAIAEAQALYQERQKAEEEARKVAKRPFTKWLAVQSPKNFIAWHPLKSPKLKSVEGTILNQEPDGTIQISGPNPRQDDYHVAATSSLDRITGFRLEVLPHATHSEGRLSRGKSGEFLLTDIKVHVRQKGNTQSREIKVAGAIADYETDKSTNNNYGLVKDTLDDDPRNGWTTKGSDPRRSYMAIFRLAEPLQLSDGEEVVFELLHRSTAGDANIGRFRLSVTDQRGPALLSFSPMPLEQLSATSTITQPLKDRLFEQFLADYEPYLQKKAALDRAQRQLNEVKAAGSVDVMVLADRKEPRETHILLRGIWDKKGDVVQPEMPSAIAPWSPEFPRTRLGLAQWLVSPENPLTARVVVNHLWQILFGEGLVRTPEDFGLQGEQPVHAELLDWLAIEFVESGWDVKKMLKLMALSAAYRQDSAVTPELLARDPQNQLLARGPRFRLQSWMLRDAALSYAGLLNPVLGGPPVRPYQPEGVWEEIFMGRFNYEPSEGAAQYRRTLYAFWRRTIAPTFLFDTAQRRSCEVRTSRTNTPLQALTLLNDETYLEASRRLAEDALAQKDMKQGIREIFLKILFREPEEKELAVLVREHQRAIQYYRKHQQDAIKLVQVGQQENAVREPELASMMLIASMILNLDEAITHE